MPTCKTSSTWRWSRRLVKSENLADRVGWHMTCFGDTDQYQPALGPAPTAVDSVINHRVVNQRQHVVVGVSGGVHVQPASLVKTDAIQTDRTAALPSQHANAAAGENLPLEAWWWD